MFEDSSLEHSELRGEMGKGSTILGDHRKESGLILRHPGMGVWLDLSFLKSSF